MTEGQAVEETCLWKQARCDKRDAFAEVAFATPQSDASRQCFATIMPQPSREQQGTMNREPLNHASETATENGPCSGSFQIDMLRVLRTARQRIQS